MKVYLEPHHGLSLAMTRVALALERSVPENEFEVTRDLKSADLVVLHVVGYPETLAAVGSLIASNQQYVILQYCLRTTQEANTAMWLPLWQRARAVVSYYDLPALLREDGITLETSCTFITTPLGVDDIFLKPHPTVLRQCGIMTSGYVAGYSGEAIEECIIAAQRCGLRHFHLGPSKVQGMTTEVTNSILGIDDVSLHGMYHRTQWVSGLRYREGFELPVIEGAACGARPIVFDRPDARRWFGDFATFVPECYGEELVGHLVQVFSRPLEPFIFPRERFDWATITQRFWSAVRTSLGSNAVQTEVV